MASNICGDIQALYLPARLQAAAHAFNDAGIHGSSPCYAALLRCEQACYASELQCEPPCYAAKLSPTLGWTSPGQAARLLFSDTTLNLGFGDVWFNARPGLGARGVAEGQGLAELLGDAAAHLPWNVACGRGPVAHQATASSRRSPARTARPRSPCYLQPLSACACLRRPGTRNSGEGKTGTRTPVPRAACEIPPSLNRHPARFRPS